MILPLQGSAVAIAFRTGIARRQIAIDGSESFQKLSRRQLIKRLILWPARRTSRVFPKDLFLEPSAFLAETTW
jgi:hypothetical protein